jgi:hypothetical protein
LPLLERKLLLPLVSPELRLTLLLVPLLVLPEESPLWLPPRLLLPLLEVCPEPRPELRLLELWLLPEPELCDGDE